MKTKIKKKEERPLILKFKANKKTIQYEKPYKYCYGESINKINNKVFISSNSEIVDLDSITETKGTDVCDDSPFIIDLDTMTKSFSDTGDEIRYIK